MSANAWRHKLAPTGLALGVPRLYLQPMRNLLQNAVIGAVWLYKRTLSPVFYFLGARCRHYPTCSDYAADAFRKHKTSRAFWLSVSRLSRCHHFGSHGFDPVPEDAPKVGWRVWRLGDWAWTERGVDETPDNRAS